MNRSLHFACLILAPFAAGCGGEPTVRVNGVLVYKGAPLQLKEDEEVFMSLVAADANAKLGLASVNFDNSTGSFTVHGPTQDGIPPGEYKVVVTCTPYQQTSPDRFRGEFSEESTPLRYRVSEQPVQEIVVDVGEPSVQLKASS